MARSRRRGGGSNNAGQIALIFALLVALVALVGGLSWLFVKANAQYVPREATTLCPKAGYTSQTLVLLDTTDALAAVTRTQVLQKLRDLVSAIPKDGFFELRLLTANAEESVPVVSLCNPGDGSDIDPLTGNPDRARDRWQHEYASKVEAALMQGIEGAEQDFSPIMETLQRMAAERLTASRDRAIPTRIVVVSDMIQHTDTYSHYRDGLSEVAYTAGPRDRLATDFAGADLEFWLVRRDSARFDLEALGAFWLHWAETNHARPPAKINALMG